MTAMNDETVEDWAKRGVDLGRGAWKAGYGIGYQEGWKAAVQAMVQAAAQATPGAPAKAPSSPTKTASVVRIPQVAEHVTSARAPKGAVRHAVMFVLAIADGGLTEPEIAANVAGIDPSISRTSIGGELRRKRDELYRQEGGRWFLLSRRYGEAAGASTPAA